MEPNLIFLRLAALGLTAGLGGAIAFGHLGWLHPAFDAFSHFRVHLAVVLVAAAFLLASMRSWPEAIFAVMLGSASLVATFGAFSGQPLHAASLSAALDPGRMPVFRLMHLNLRYDNASPELVYSAIGRHRPDILTLNEVSDLWLERLTVLDASYPYRAVCPQRSRIGGVAILSRRPFVSDPQTACSDRGTFGSVVVDFAGRKASVVAMHLGWPWPFEQEANLSRLQDDLAEVDETALLAGDFNAVPWSWTVREAARIGGFDILRGIGPTWLDRRLPDALRPLIGLPIDQVMAKGGIVVGSARTLDAVGSDHLPILVEFSILPDRRDQTVLQAMR